MTRRAGSRTSGWDKARQQARDRPVLVPGDVVKCLAELGVTVVRVVGDEALAHCPGHLRLVGKPDAHPSWSVNLDSGIHNCFGCGFRGPFAVVVREVLGLDFDDADDWVRTRGSLDRVRRELTGVYIHELVPKKADTSEADLALLVDPPDDVLASRGITADAARHYGVLFDPLVDCWITPIRDPVTHDLWGWQEKSAWDRYFRNRPRHVPKADTLFGLDHPALGSRAILVESPLDACVIESAGWVGAVSSFGAGVSDTQMQIIIDRFDSLILALDNDPDGIKATRRIIEGWGKRLPIRVMPYLTDAKDPGEMPDPLLNECLSKARYPFAIHPRADH